MTDQKILDSVLSNDCDKEKEDKDKESEVNNVPAEKLECWFLFDNNGGEVRQSLSVKEVWQTFFGNKKTIQNAQFLSKNCNIVSYFTMKITYPTR